MILRMLEVLGTEDDPLGWQTAGACVGTDPDLWFPGRGESTREAREICARCPVRQECLEYALDTGEKYGMWGGKSERERRRLRRARRRAP